MHFRFDSNHALYASHHQKLVVIDGAVAFVGGLDICGKQLGRPKALGRRCGAGLARRAVRAIPRCSVVSVRARSPGSLRSCSKSGGSMREGRRARPCSRRRRRSRPARLEDYFPLSANRAAISVTRAQTLLPLLEPVMDIRQLYLDAIAAAERLIYIENQYFTSQAVYEALKRRLDDRPALPPDRFDFTEAVPHVGGGYFSQRCPGKNAEIAGAGSPHDQTAPSASITRRCAHGGRTRRKPTYIHSKVLIVDDRFLSVGSANITNRSMGMDTELNLSWEADCRTTAKLVSSIRHVRANLLAEHTGLRKLSQRRALGSVEGLVDYLNERADRSGCRLRRHTMESFLEDVSWIKDLMPDDLVDRSGASANRGKHL